ncbi:dipeptide ABC transporter ATP-binding protein [Clostridium sp. MCC353]|uniref:ABC transporter ATP-binding protein n=1 Tax=Clostridium sp. MCC353 TaxID=2592646 RepID=UPI001C02D533|nr:dipeptide ABC transporter ATP-binding protein [Clostridium sp. MCC353]MBT9779101.1 dipeptide ABC transporter ATP-binding protein [Clostridium sp. MCC353]
MQEPLIEVKNLKQEFRLTKGLLQSLRFEDGKIVKEDKIVHAVNDVSFTIQKGEVFSLVGESGCGKSTTARTIIRLLEPAGGQVFYKGNEISHLKPNQLLPYRKDMQMIFQDPYASLNPKQRVEDIITEPMLFHKIVNTKEEARKKCMEILERVGLRPEQASRYPHQFSGGQRQRIGVARALAVQPEFIIADEPVSALDVSIQAQILNLLMDLKDEFNFSYLFIAHDLSVVRHISDRLGVMYLGGIVEMGDKNTIFANPLHPYTRLLFSAVPTVGEAPLVESVEIEGEIPNPVNLPSGCYFHDRCPYATDLCRKERPELKDIGGGHCVACHQVQGK